jgi:hypothetical protein
MKNLELVNTTLLVVIAALLVAVVCAVYRPPAKVAPVELREPIWFNRCETAYEGIDTLKHSTIDSVLNQNQSDLVAVIKDDEHKYRLFFRHFYYPPEPSSSSATGAR